MSKVEVGKTVKHKEYGFIGTVERIHWDNQVDVRITEGENPLFKGKDDYTAYVGNLEVVEPADAFEQVLQQMVEELTEHNEEEEAEEIERNGYVNLTMGDGTEINFEYYNDFHKFMELQKTQK